MKVQDWQRDLQIKKELRKWERQGKNKCTVERQFNEPLCNEVLDLANDFLYPYNSKIYEKEYQCNKTSL